MKNEYQRLVRRVLDYGTQVQDRTGVGTLSIFGGTIAYDLRDRFPVEQAKETNWRTAFLEMLFFLGGHTNVSWLNKRGSKLWDPWAGAYGGLGPIYGAQWRAWQDSDGSPIDQVRAVIDEARSNPTSRRLIVEGWNVADLPDMALPPCHKSHQLSCTTDGYVDMLVYQRSWDLALGAPFNIAQYALLLSLYARELGRKPRRLTFAFGDAHVYTNHVEQMREVVEREFAPDPAALVFNTDNTDIDGYDFDDFDVIDYCPQPKVKLEVAV